MSLRSWIVLAGQIPSYIDAVFETVSGFTTTGASILTDVEGGAKGVDRAVVQGHPPQKKQDYKDQGHGDIDAVEDDGGIPDPGHQLAYHSLRYAFFQVGSVITTTGFATADFNLWPELSRMLLMVLMLVGACDIFTIYYKPYYSFRRFPTQTLGARSISMGKISRRPRSISRISTTLERLERLA